MLAVSVPRPDTNPPESNEISYAIPHLTVPEAEVCVLFFDARPDPVFDTATKSASLAGDYLGAKFVANPAAKRQAVRH
jgi:hypothetical protein